jgi:hypothetical protein
MPPMFMIELSDVVPQASEDVGERIRFTFEKLRSSEVRIAHIDMSIEEYSDEGVNVSYMSPMITVADT